MMTSYNYRLVALSILISLLASYAALDLAGRAGAMPGDQEKFLAAGMGGYISKPVRAQELIKIVEEHTSLQTRIGRLPRDANVVYS